MLFRSAVVLEKTLESPLDARRSNQSILKEISPGLSLEGMMLGAGTLGVPLGGTRRVGGLLGVAGRLSGCFFAFLFHGDGLDPCPLYNVTNLIP